MDLYAAFAVDTKREDEGRWVVMGGTAEKPARMLIASLSGQAYQRLMASQYKSYKTILEREDAEAEAKLVEMVDHAIATCTLLKSENLEVKGVELAASYDNIRKVLKMPELRPLRDRILKEANDASAYKLQLDAEDSKNSKPA